MSPAGKPAVVVIDDHDDTREMASEALRMQGFVVHDFARAEDALEHVRREPPRAVVSDLSLEGMSGEELARALRGGEATRRLVLIAMTGRSRTGSDELWDRVLTKPIDPFRLGTELRELIATD